MALDIADVIAIIYISFQLVISVCISIAGAVYVRNEFIIQKKKLNEISKIELQIKTNQMESAGDEEKKEKKEEKEEKEEKENKQQMIRSENKINKISKTHFLKLYCKVVWKMRSVYTSFGVHIFDVLTDILVITNWYNVEQQQGDIQHIDARTMAYCGIAVLLFHRLITMIAFWIKEKNWTRCILQFGDLLIFEEIYLCHQRVVNQFKNQLTSKTEEYKKKNGVETTNSFKFVRNLEAIFESLPQSILQMVFIMRTSSLQQYSSTTLLIISILSIIQSIISMTNSITKNDNIYMVLPKFDEYKKRLPPTLPFIKHALCRISDIISRIALMSLFWTVCGGFPFAIFMFVEVLNILSMIIIEYKYEDRRFSVEDIFLRIQLFMVIPSELMYAVDATKADETFNCMDMECCDSGYMFETEWIGDSILSCCFVLCCCYWPAVLLSTCCKFRNETHYVHPNFRLGLSLMEWIILILWPFIDETKWRFLYSTEHGLYIFIVGIICYLFSSQYLVLFPDFSLPHNVNIRSRFGYALNGELEELKRIKLKPDSVWDEGVKGEDDKYRTVAMFAICNNHQHIVEWLETEKKATKHKVAIKRVNTKTKNPVVAARILIDPKYEYFSKPVEINEFDINTDQMISGNGHMLIQKVDIGYKIKPRLGHQSLRIKFSEVPDRYYYEIHLHSVGDIRVGFAADEYSWSYNPFKQRKWNNNNKKEEYGENCVCRVNDIIGCFVDIKNKNIKFALNGNDLGMAFSDLQFDGDRIYPCCSVEAGGSMTMVFDEDRMAFKPLKNEGYRTFDGRNFIEKEEEKEANEAIGSLKRFEYKADFDRNGIIYYLGTNGGTTTFKNPAENGIIKAAVSDKMVSKPITAICGRELVKCRTVEARKPNTWWMLDFGDNKMKLRAYSLKHYDDRVCVLRSWRLEGKHRNGRWKVISNHENDESLKEKEGATKTWIVESNEFYSQFSLIMTRENSYGNWWLSCSGVEFYGDLQDDH